MLRYFSNTLTSKPEQQWYLTDNASKIYLANTTLCLDAGAKSELIHDEFRNKYRVLMLVEQLLGRIWPTST